MKKVLLCIFFLCPALAVLACPVCEKQQPEILRGITHGAGPEDRWDYVIVWAMVVIVLLTLFFSVKWLVRPGERSQHHIKRLILNNE
ncbi:MAG TPA: hypothetical protein PLL71_15325 [Agriterribacter sp.]|nr:hypothetical protein [Agriterribacter sp.]HRQ50442.1 hypothetical protein [Agriterribacter sp.]